MKKLYTTMVLVAMLSFVASSQVLLTEDFSSGVPPTGWNITAHADNWSSAASANAGGTSPEAKFSWSPQFNGDSYLFSPQVNTSGHTTLGFSFRHMVDHYGGPYTLGVATRSGGGDWNSIWELVNPTGSVPGEEVSILFTNSDIGAADFEIAFYFTGDSYNINYWYIDDAKLFVPYDHDVATKKVLGEQYFTQGDLYAASALVANAGLNSESFDVVLEIYGTVTDDLLFTDTQTVNKLDPGFNATVDFDGFNLPSENSLFDVVVYTNLPGDMDPDNDTSNMYINTYTTERELVILEIATGTWCGYCPGAAMGADDLIHNGHPVAVLEHHGGDDYETPESDARIDFYGITGYPTAVFDGTEQVVGGSASNSMYPTYAPIVDARATVKSAFETDIFGDDLGGGNYHTVVTIDRMAEHMYSNLSLIFGVSESHIAESWQGQDSLHFVTRLLLPDHMGTPIDMLANEHVEIPLDFTIEASWVADHCEIVYFLQDMDTKEILQGGKVMVNALLPTGIEEDLNNNGVAISNIYPNPFSTETNISFSLIESGNVVVSIYDMTGREVSTLVNGEMAAGEHLITWNAGNDVPNGIYFCTISTADAKITQKVMLSK
ncbi:MAG: T9SS type A sorting domain-containing protein [Bacteroidota bacterium]